MFSRVVILFNSTLVALCAAQDLPIVGGLTSSLGGVAPIRRTDATCNTGPV